MKLLLLLLLGFTVSAKSKVEKKVLYRGSSYNFVFEQMTETNDKGIFTAKYFYMTSAKSKNSNGFSISTIFIEEVKYLISELRLFANYPLNYDYSVIYDAFILKRYMNATDVILIDKNGGFLKLSKTSALRLATEIENKIYLIN